MTEPEWPGWPQTRRADGSWNLLMRSLFSLLRGLATAWRLRDPDAIYTFSGRPLSATYPQPAPPTPSAKPPRFLQLLLSQPAGRNAGGRGEARRRGFRRMNCTERPWPSRSDTLGPRRPELRPARRHPSRPR